MSEATDLRTSTAAEMLAANALVESREAGRRAQMGVVFDDYTGIRGLDLQDGYLRILLEEHARGLVYGEGDIRATASIWNDVKVNPDGPSERAVRRFVDEVITVLRKAAGEKHEGFALGKAHEVTQWVKGADASAAAKAVHKVAVRAAVVAPQHAAQVESRLAEVAASGITSHFTDGATPSTKAILWDGPQAFARLYALADYLGALTLTPLLANAERSEFGLKGDVLNQAAQDAMAPLRDSRGGISRDQHRAARKAAVHGTSHELLSGRDAWEFDENIDSPVENEVESTWDIVLPLFEPLGVKDIEELQVIISEMRGELPEHVPGLKDIKTGAIARHAKDDAERKRLRRAMKNIQENAATVGPAMVELLNA